MKNIILSIAVLLLLLSIIGGICYGQQVEPGPTPAGDDPEEWSTWLDDAEDVEVRLVEDYDPILTYGGSYSVPRRLIKQSLLYNVAVKIELGYAEVASPIDPSKLGGLGYQGEVVTELVEPVARGALGDPRGPVEPGPRPRPTPEKPGPRPRPTRPPEMRPVPGGRDGQGRVIRDVVISDRETPGAVRREARRVSSVRIIEPVRGPVEVERTPWHSSYAVRQGPVWVRLEVEE